MGRVFSGNPVFYDSLAFDMKAILNLTPDVKLDLLLILILSSHTNNGLFKADELTTLRGG